MKQQRRKESKKERKQEGKEWMRLTRRRWMRKKILRKENKNCTMCEGHLHISLGRAEVCATVVVCLFLLSLPASVALFLTSVCLGSLWGLLWRLAPPSMTPPLFPFYPFISPKPLQTLPSLKVPDGHKWWTFWTSRSSKAWRELHV